MKESIPSKPMPSLNLIAVLLILMLLNGCSSHLAASSMETDDKTTIRLMFPTYTGEVNSPELIAYLENKWNINLEMIQVPSSSYNSRARIVFARQNGPDALVWTAFPQAELFNLARTGQLHQLDEYVAKSPNLQNIPSFIWDNSRIDGSLYGLPRPRAMVDQAVFIRKDWLDNLGLPLPTSIDDYTRTAALFATNDPDHNGKSDTYGFAAAQNLGSVWEMSYAFDTGHFWKETSDGRLVHSHLTEGREKALQWLRKLYATGGIDPSYNKWNTNQMHERFVTGHTGIMISQISNFYYLHKEMTAHDPNAELVLLPPPVGPSGVSGFAERLGFSGQVIVPAHVPDEKVEIILSFLDWMSSEEADQIRKYGLKGIHHHVQEDGSLQVDYERMERENLLTFFFMNSYDPYLYVTPHAPPHIQQQQQDMLDQIRTLGIPDPAAAFMSTAQYRIGSVFSRDINHYFNNYVTGKIAEDSVEQFRREWLNNGGQLATEEVNKWYMETIKR